MDGSAGFEINPPSPPVDDGIGIIYKVGPGVFTVTSQYNAPPSRQRCMSDLCDVYTRARLLIRLSDNSPGSTSQPLHRVSPFESETSVCTLVPANPLYYPTVRAIQRFQLLFRETSRIVESSPPAKNDIRTIGNSRSVDRRQEWEREEEEGEEDRFDRRCLP